MQKPRATKSTQANLNTTELPSANSFETSLTRLQQIVENLESGSLPLEDCLRLFEEGIALTRESQTLLDAAEKRVEELLAIDENGNPVVRELETT